MTTAEINELLKRITSVPGMLGGKPVIRGMRFPVSDILEMLASGMTADEIVEQHPILEKEDVSAALLLASIKVKNSVISNAA
jgi:uncharacterized protein (DUF433 family)